MKNVWINNMKKLLSIIFVSLLLSGNAYAFGDVSYVCEWDGDSGDKELYQIKNKKVYLNGELIEADGTLKITKLSVFLNKIEIISVWDGVTINDHFSGKITTIQKINLSKETGFEIRTAENGFYDWQGSKAASIIDKSPRTEIGKCYKM